MEKNGYTPEGEIAGNKVNINDKLNECLLARDASIILKQINDKPFLYKFFISEIEARLDMLSSTDDAIDEMEAINLQQIENAILEYGRNYDQIN